MVEGAALGAGSTMGRMAVNAIFGGSSQHSPAESKQGEAYNAQ